MKVILEHDQCVLLHGDSAQLGDVLPPNSVDAIVCDPPAGISFMGKSWDSDKGGRDKWIAWLADLLKASVAALKPGGYALVWAIPRTSHWTATALEDAGLEVRDIVMHLFGTGFPKSLDISKAIDAHLGVEGGRGAMKRGGERLLSQAPGGVRDGGGVWGDESGRSAYTYAAGSPEAAQWEGFGTALKPAAEHWILARKPLEGTYAENVLKYGTGGLNIDACRIETSDDLNGGRYSDNKIGTDGASYGTGINKRSANDYVQPAGRWPANVTFDEEAAAILDEQSGTSRSGVQKGARGRRPSGFVNTTAAKGDPRPNGPQYGDTGGASRFFYVAKPGRKEKDAGLEHLKPRSGGEATDRQDGSAGLNNPRAGAGRTGGARNYHPTCKGVALMRWLIRLITPPGGTVLDPFAGSGSTGVAAIQEGVNFIGCELGGDNDEYLPILTGRIRHALGLPPETSEVEETEATSSADTGDETEVK